VFIRVDATSPLALTDSMTNEVNAISRGSHGAD
jgi:hypothetical protein